MTTPIHNRVRRRLAQAIERRAPPQWQVDTDISVRLRARSGRPAEMAPDVVVYSSDCGLFDTPVDAEDIVLVAEVVSPTSLRTDRMEHPQDYAAAGIPHYWRVETPTTNTNLQIFTYRLKGRTYSLDRDYRGVLSVEQPFRILMEVPMLAR